MLEFKICRQRMVVPGGWGGVSYLLLPESAKTAWRALDLALPHSIRLDVVVSVSHDN